MTLRLDFRTLGLELTLELQDLTWLKNWLDFRFQDLTWFVFRTERHKDLTWNKDYYYEGLQISLRSQDLLVLFLLQYIIHICVDLNPWISGGLKSSPSFLYESSSSHAAVSAAVSPNDDPEPHPAALQLSGRDNGYRYTIIHNAQTQSGSRNKISCLL